MKAIYILNQDSYNVIYGPEERADIRRLVQLTIPEQIDPQEAKDNAAVLKDVDIIFSGWGAPKLDSTFLSLVPKLKAFFYGAGSIRGAVTEEFWAKNIPITSSWTANAVPVAEFTLAEILFSLKRGWFFMESVKTAKGHSHPRPKVPGGYGSTVGIISLGVIGRMVCEHLKPFDLKVIAYDPFISSEVARQLNVQLVELEEAFRRSDVISLHTPWLKETEGMITGHHFRLMKKDSTFINTARGAVIKETEMIDVLRERPDIYAVLDVTYPEPPPPDSPLYTLPNVVITPHIAGSMDAECRRMGRYVVDDLANFLKGAPLKWRVTRDMAQRMA